MENAPLFEADPMIDQVVDGRFKIVCTVGTGSWSRVFKARELETGRDVALKIMHARLVSDPEIVARFDREIQSGLRLHHPNICSLIGYGTLISGQPYIVMEFIEGETLSSLLRRRSHLSLEEAMPIFQSCCDALHQAHSENIIHRDIKPGNIMISKNREVKLLDFGLAKFICQGQPALTQAGIALGTFRYLSPEQALGESVDARSDTYSLACVFYEMLAGCAVFEGGSVYEVLDQHVHCPPRRFRQLHWSPAVPGCVESIILKALSKDPAQRIQSALALKQEVQAALLRHENSWLKQTLRHFSLSMLAFIAVLMALSCATAVR
jgi:serine/threonine-protein kinase